MEESRILRIIPFGVPVSTVYIMGTPPHQVRLNEEQIALLVRLRPHICEEWPLKRTSSKESDAQAMTLDPSIFQIRTGTVGLTGTRQHWERLWTMITKGTQFLESGCAGCDK